MPESTSETIDTVPSNPVGFETPKNSVEPDIPLEPIRREHRRGADTPATNAVDNGTAPEKNAKQLEFASFTKPGEGDGGALRENKVLKLKEMKQLLDNDYKKEAWKYEHLECSTWLRSISD